MTSDLYISTFAPTLGSGRAMRSYTCVRALALLGPVDLAYIPHDGDGPSDEYLAIDGVRFHRIVPSRGVRRAAVYLSKRSRGIPAVCCRGVSPELIAAAVRLAAAPGRGRVIVDDLNAATALMPWAQRHPVIYNAHNLYSNYRHDHARGMQKSMLTYERRLLRVVAESWMVSRLDMQIAAQVNPQARLRYVPNAVDVAAIEPVFSSRPVRSTVLMVADFTYPPNRIASEFLVDQVMPHVWRELPGARVRLVGRGSRELTSTDARVELAGFVDDLTAAYRSCDCVAVPITSGGGSPLKFIEALAYGVPVVATPFAARGLEARPAEHFLLGSNAGEFASAVLGVLRDGAPEIAVRARELAQSEYSVQALAQRLQEPIPASGAGKYPARTRPHLPAL